MNKRIGRRRRKKIDIEPVAITSVLLVIQFFFIVLAYTILEEYQGIFNISWHIISIILCIFIINKEENSAYKIAWILPMCIFPLVGIMLYFFIKILPGTKLLSEILEHKIDISAPYIKQDKEVKRAFKNIDANYSAMANFLYEYEKFPVYANTDLEYYSLGEYAFESIKKELLKAKKYIFIEFFIVSKGVMLNEFLDILEKKVNEGVEVRFMYDGANMFSLPHDFDEFIRSKGIDCRIFSPVKAVISSYQNNRDHRKIIVIDGKVGFTGGINIADEYINKKERFGHWKDCAVKIEGEAVKSITAMFLQMWNINDNYEIEDYNIYLINHDEKQIEEKQSIYHINKLLNKKAKLKLKEKYKDIIKNKKSKKIRIQENTTNIKDKKDDKNYIPIKKYDNYVIPYADYPSNTNNPAEAIYIHILFYAKKYVDIMTPYLIIDDELISAMRFSCKRGVRIRLLLPGIPDKKIPYMVAESYFTELISLGVEIYVYTKGFVHSKIFVSDNIVSTVGTVNLDYRSLYLHFENGIFCYDREIALDIEEDFEKTLKISKKISIDYYKNKPVERRLAGRFMRVFAPLM